MACSTLTRGLSQAHHLAPCKPNPPAIPVLESLTLSCGCCRPSCGRVPKVELLPVILEGIVLFSVVWSIGATCDGQGRGRFDGFFRALISDAVDPRPERIDFDLGPGLEIVGIKIPLATRVPKVPDLSNFSVLLPVAANGRHAFVALADLISIAPELTLQLVNWSSAAGRGALTPNP
jgi:Dynein heavy chain AAA lid domain